MLEEAAIEVIQDKLQNELLRFSPAQGSTEELKFLPDNKLQHTYLTDYRVYYHNKKYQFAIDVLSNDQLISILFLTSAGNWIGRDRKTNGFCSILTQDTKFWKEVSNPVAFNKKIKPKNVDDGFTYQDILPPQLKWPDFDISKTCKKEGDTALVLIACDRPQYLQETAQSLAACPEFSKYPLYIFLDKPEDPKKEFVTEQQLRIINSALPQGKLVLRPMNYGCGKNLIDARRQMFDKLGYDKVFIFEDDMVVSPNYVDICLNLLSWSEKYSNVGIVQAWNPCFITTPQKMIYRGLVIPTIENLWGYLITKKCWDSIKPLLYKYEELFLGGQYKLRPHKSIQTWFRLQMKKGREKLGDNEVLSNINYETELKRYLDFIPTTQDGCTNLAMWVKGWTRLATFVNRGRYIGKYGIHSNPTMFNNSRFGEIILDGVVEDHKFKVDNNAFYKALGGQDDTQ